MFPGEDGIVRNVQVKTFLRDVYASHTIQLYFTTLATQQKLVSRWGVGKHVTIKYVYIFKIEVYYIESVRSSRGHGGRGGKFAFEIRKRFCGPIPKICLIYLAEGFSE